MTNFVIVILTIILVVSCLIIRSYRDSVNKQLHTIEELKAKIADCERASIQSEAVYHVVRMDNEHPEFKEYNNCWGVYRSAKVNGRNYHTTIKIFTDRDADFNQREAEDLCETLNSK